jgi:hypothetical protein
MIRITEKEHAELSAELSPRGIDYQSARVVKLLATGDYRTGVICNRCSVSNISDLVTKQINPKIIKLGFFVGCVRPPLGIKNRFGQPASDWIWSLHKVPKSASNDDEIGSTVDDWEAELLPSLSNSSEKE